MIFNPSFSNQKNFKFTYSKNKDVLDKSDENSYHILFLGPTGSGKSHLINNLFNLKVAKSSAGFHSVTSQVDFYEGKTTYGKIKKKDRTLVDITKNVIVTDTIGL